MNLVKMKREVFESLTEDALSWACIEPTILQIRGKSPAVKAAAYAGLTTGLRALMMFRVLYDHARDSVEEFYGWVAHLLAEPKTLAEIHSGLEYFGADAMLGLLEETAGWLEARNRQADGTLRAVRPRDLEEDGELAVAVERLYERFLENAESTLRLIGAKIRTNTGEFVQIEA